jgi:uncharacterized protein (DUF1015 family)
MADIRPFRGVRYNPAKIADLAAVISPPYDIISPQQQDSLYQNNQYNFVRIEYNRETTQDNPADNRYTRASANIASWLKSGVLMQDQTPAIYLHAHTFQCQGKPHLRYDLTAALKLEEWDTRIVRPHENIIPRAKSDRMAMLAACQGNTSTVLAMYSDPHQVIAGVISRQSQYQPAIDFTDPWGEGHQVWLITDPESIAAIRREFAAQPVYIADGHHRYDSALTYRRERLAQTTGNDEGFNYVMTSLIDFKDPGMVILPTHRLVKGIPPTVLGGLKSQLSQYFDLQDIPVSGPQPWLKLESLLSGLTPDMRQVHIGLYGLEKNAVTLLTLRDFKTTGDLMPSDHAELYKKLDVSLVDHIILERLLGYDKNKEDIQIAYTHEKGDAVDRVRNGEYQLSFLLNPVGADVIKGIADAADRMPRKSTYFYPKAPAGLFFYKW